MIQIGAAHRQKAAQIAFATNVNPSSVSRENKRNRIPDGDGTVERERAQRYSFVCAGCPKKHSCSLRRWAYNPAAAEQMAAFRKKDPRRGAGSDEETVRVAEKAIQEGFAKKKGVYKSLSAARLLGKVKPSTAYGWLKKGYIDPGEGGYAHPIRTKKRNQKGSVENSNGQLRRFFRRGAYIDDVSGAFVAECTVTISGEPIKSLSGSTPAEAVKEAFGEELFEKPIDAVRKRKA